MCMKWLRLAVIPIIAVAAVACQSGPADAVAALKADFPVIERLQVADLNVGEQPSSCEYLDYIRGKFVTDPSSKSCAGFLLGNNAATRFDDQARADLDSMLREFDLHGRRPRGFFANFSPDGHVTGVSSFVLAGDTNMLYVYDPGAAMKVQRHTDSACAEAIDADWYREWAC